MPASTPIYSFPYPCPDERVSAMDFLNLANAIDAKMAEVRDDMIFALNRPNVDLDVAGTQGIPPGVVTVLTTADSTYTIAVAGVWVVFVEVISTGAAPATVTYQRAAVRQNAVVRFLFSQDSESNIAAACPPVCVIVAAAGDVITSTFQYTGTGTYTVQTKLSAKLLCRIP
jgi:hypothetical protein